MKKRMVITTLGFAVAHLVLATGTLVLAFSSGMKSFDNPDYQPSGLAQVADHLAAILLQPVRSLWTPWMSKNLPNVVEWGLYLANSLLWGFLMALLVKYVGVFSSGKKRS